MDKIQIVAALAHPGKISFESDRFEASASVDDNGVIWTEVNPVVAGPPLISPHLAPYIPRVVAFAYWIIRHTPVWILTILATLLIVLRYPHLFLSGSAVRSIDSILPYLDYLLVNAGWIFLLVFVIFLWRIHHFTARWHAAEHMTFAAYQLHGTTDFETIARQSPIQDRCGGRYALPLLITIGLVMGAQNAFSGLAHLVFCFISLEVFFLLDEKIGLDKIPIISHTSRWTQRYITTRPPGTLELLTARAALQALIAAHAEPSEVNSSPTPPR